MATCKVVCVRYGHSHIHTLLSCVEVRIGVPIPFPAPESGASAELGGLDSEPSNEPFPTELRPSTVVDNLVVLKHFLLDVDVSEFSIFCVQDIGSVLLVLDVLFTEDPIEGYGTAESELLSDFCCGVRLRT